MSEEQKQQTIEEAGPAQEEDGSSRAAVIWQIRPEHLYKAVGLAFILALFFLYFPVVSQLILLVYASAIVAVALNPIARKIPLQRGWTAAAAAILTFTSLGVLAWLGARVIMAEVRGLSQVVPDLEEQLVEWEAGFRELTGIEIYILGDQPLQEIAGFFAETVTATVLGHAFGVLSAIFIPLIILIGGFFALGSPNKSLLEPMLRLIPRDRRPAYYRILSLLDIRIFGWIRGTLLAMLGVGILSTVALFILGVEYALILGIFMGIMEFIPIVGPWIGAAPAVAIAFFDDPTKGVLTVIVLFGVQQIESQIITPFAMSSQAHVHPTITLFSLILFGGLFGVLGIILALPLVLLIATIVQVLWVEGAIQSDADYITPIGDG